MLTGCPFCRHTDNSLYCDDHEQHSGGSRDILKCNECGLLYPHERMDKDEAVDYLKTIHSNQESFEFVNPKGLFTKNNYIVRLSSDIEAKGKSLDIGTFDGRFTYILGELGFDSYGLEPQEKAVEFAQSHGLKVFKGSCPDDIPENLLKQKYRLILMNETIYYLQDLKGSLSLINSMLDKNGLLLIACHQGNSRYYTYGNYSYFSRYMDHVQGIPTIDSLEYCLNKSGFRPVNMLNFTNPNIYERMNYTESDMHNADKLIILSKKE